MSGIEKKYNKKNKKNTSSWGRELFDIFETTNKQKLTHYVVDQVIKNKVPMMTFGKQGEIYIVALPYEWWEKYFLVAKKKRNTSENEYFDLREEFRMHSLVYQKIDHPVVKVPELFGYQESMKWEQFVVMEFVPGQTLYTLLLNTIIKRHKPERDPAKNDREADKYILQIFGFEKAKLLLTKLEANPYLYQNTQFAHVFSKEESMRLQENIKDFLGQMHAMGIYHRDLWWSLRNIMFCPDGKIYIIDFWKAVLQKNQENVYQERTKDEIKEYVSDEEILNIIQTYTH
jgi:serine/threonine protein kinase